MFKGTYKVIAHMSGALLGSFSYTEAPGSQDDARKAAKDRQRDALKDDGTRSRVVHYTIDADGNETFAETAV